MKPGPVLASKIILETTALDAPPQPLVDILSKIAMDQGWVDTDAEAREKAELWHDATLNHLIHEINELSRMGRPARIDFNSSSEYLIQGSCFPEPHETTTVKEAKQRRFLSSSIVKEFEKLSPEEFELLCGRILGLFGVEEPKVTRYSADEGIDFYGLLRFDSIFFPNDLSPTIQRQLNVWLVGQAKHYRRIQSGTSEIRDLVGAVTLGRVRAFSNKIEPYADLNIRVGDPVFALLITTGSLSSNAWRLLNNSGIIGVDGQMLAAFLSDRGIGTEHGEFNSSRFAQWLRDSSVK